MYKFFSFVLVLAVTFMLTDISAQGRGGVDQLTMSHVSKIVPSQVDQVMDLLYDQTANGNTNGYTSQDFEAAFDPYDNQAADDFTATDNWTIDQVVVTGSYSVAGPADGFNVFFYTNNGGMPGTEVYNAPSQAYTYDAGTGMFTITLASPAELPAGDYWVSVQCRMDFGTAGQWYWNQVDGSYGSVAQWQNPGGGFGTSCATWGSIQGCISAIGTDMYFALYGTVGGGGGGAVIFSDNFDSYTAGQQLACQNPTDWTTWNLNPCDPVTDSYVSSNYAHSGANSFVVVADNDEVHYWGPETSGKWEIDFYSYIPSGKAGYFNTLGQFIATQEWGLEVYFNAGGGASVNAGGTGAATFNYPYDTWTLNQCIVDLDNDLAEYWFNGNMIIQWTWTAGSNGSPIALSLEANDFYGATANDEMYVDDYQVIDLLYVPVELTSFTANVVNGNVQLEWSTATETNNKGFEVQKKFGNEFHTIAFVEGNGTSTQQHTYSYTDNDVANGNYSYRLRQVDFDGTSEYSQVVEVTVERPAEYNLAQNYPNPFNPSTKINYGLKVDSKVTLKVFDILGQEVVTLLNQNMTAGNHTVTFDASKLNSGVYLYKIEATGVDGSSFTSVKKMILTK